jgi:hypothetical protein
LKKFYRKKSRLPKKIFKIVTILILTSKKVPYGICQDIIKLSEARAGGGAGAERNIFGSATLPQMLP